MFRIYYLDDLVKIFATREEATKFVYSKKDWEDYEILDGSDDQ